MTKEWKSRGYLPHRDKAGLRQHVIFRLVDSLPADTLARMEQEVQLSLNDLAGKISEEEMETRRRTERGEIFNKYLDQGYGAGILRAPDAAKIVCDSLHYHDGKHYELLAWCVMPNHVHVLIKTQGFPLSRIVQSWKTFTAREINRFTGKTGPFWHREWYDRYIRNESHFREVSEYIVMNPVRAGLVGKWPDWPWSGVATNGTEIGHAEWESHHKAEQELGGT